MISEWIDHGIQVGDFVCLPDENIAGEVTNVFRGVDDNPASCVVRLIEGNGWAAIDLSLCSPHQAKRMN